MGDLRCHCAGWKVTSSEHKPSGKADATKGMTTTLPPLGREEAAKPVVDPSWSSSVYLLRHEVHMDLALDKAGNLFIATAITGNLPVTARESTR